MDNFEPLNMIEQYPTKKFFFDLVKDYDNPIEIQKNWINSQKIINKDKKIRFFKTHHLFCKYGENAFTDDANTLGVIHIVRDPRNIVASLKHHWNLKNLEEAKEKLFDINMMTGFKVDSNKPYSFPVMISSWDNHYNAWKKIKKNYLLIKFEDLINDPKKELYRIIEYLNKIKKIEVSENKINNIVQSTSFNNFKALEEKGLFNEANIDTKTNKFKTFFNTHPTQYKGNLINIDMKNKIEKKFHKEMKELNYL